MQAYDQFLGFVFRLNESIEGKPLSAPCHVSPVSRSALHWAPQLNWFARIPFIAD
jgi:hypothetical protein